MTLVEIHSRLATTMILMAFVAGGWGLARYALKRGIDGTYWGILAVSEVLILVQSALGIVLWFQGARPGRTIHLLYGVVAVILLPALYAYLQGRDDRRAAMLFGFLCSFLAGIGFRALGTGQ